MTSYLISKETRVAIGLSVLGLALMIIIGALAYYQVLRHESFAKMSDKNRIRIQPIIPKRGLIYDRHMEVIADNTLSFTVSIVPFERDPGVTVPMLAELLNMDSVAIEKRMRTNFVSRYIPAPIKRGLDIDVISILEERGHDYPGVSYSVESVRRYDSNLSVESFVGYLGEISTEEIELPQYDDYQRGSLIGKNGIEKTYDRILRGVVGDEYIEVTARGQIVGPYRGKKPKAAVPGSDIVLTIDKDLQRFIVEKFDSVHCCGSVVAMDPRNGEILALASFPYFDPNIFSGVIPPETWEEIVADTNHPLLNRPLAGLFPPASTVKPVTAGAALEAGYVSDEYLLKPCTGGMQFGNRYFRCWEAAGHGRTNVYGAIEVSCDVYFYQLGQMMGVDSWSKYARECGFGQKTGVDIPGEATGIVPSSDYYNDLYGPRNWSPYLVLNLSIGQGEFSITPLQLAQFYCGLANRGKVMKPHLLREIIKTNGETEMTEPALSFRLPFSKEVLQTLHRALELVVHGKDGTARAIARREYRTAGKTGTAQNPHGDEHSWFAGYAPAAEPRIVVVVLAENAGHGSEVAAPLAGRIIHYYLSRQGVPLAAGGGGEQR